MSNNSFQRWQEIGITQRGATSSMLIALSSAALAFVTSLVQPGQDHHFQFIGTWSSILYQCHALLEIASLACGIFFSLNRLDDFRLTAQISRRQLEGATQSDLAMDQAKANMLGKRTQVLFAWQCRLFLAAAVAFFAFSTIHFWPALYPSQ